MKKFAALLPIVVLAPACSAIVTGAPERSLEPKRDLSATVINATLKTERIEELALNPRITRFQRNEIIYASIAEVDELYFDYEQRISTELRDSNFLVALAGIGVGSAGSLVGERASQVMSAISGGLAGAKKAFDSEVLIDRTIQALQAQMRARRAEVKTNIFGKLNEATIEYPLQAAISDLAKYRQAGTIVEALLAISERASEEDKAAKQALEVAEKIVLSVDYAENGSTIVFEEYLSAKINDPEETSRRLSVLQTLAVNQVSASDGMCDLPPDILLYQDSPTCRSVQQGMVRALKEMGEI